jgi:hypothetical protein
MEIETVVTTILIIIYLIYSFYSQKEKMDQTKPGQEPPPQEWTDFDDWKQEQQEQYEEPKREPLEHKELTHEPIEQLKREKPKTLFQEFTPPVREVRRPVKKKVTKEMELQAKKMQERLSNMERERKKIVVEEKGAFKFDPVDAVIYHEIMKRKF